MNSKIVVLIPAYKKEFIKATLISALNQTQQPELIVISDDSHENIITYELKDFIKTNSLPTQKIVFIEGPKAGGVANISHLLNSFEDSGYDLTHLLFDDDVVTNNFYECHCWSLKENPESLLSISKRTAIDQNSLPLNMFSYPSWINRSNSRRLNLTPDLLYKTTVTHNINWLGEFSNCIFRSSAARQAARCEMQNIPYYGLNDIGFFLQLSELHPISFVNDFMGCFRISPESNSSNKHLKLFMSSVFAWLAIGIRGWSIGMISDAELATCAKNVVNNHLRLYGAEESQLLDAVRAISTFSPNGAEGFVIRWFEFLEGFTEGKNYLKYIDKN